MLLSGNVAMSATNVYREVKKMQTFYIFAMYDPMREFEL